MPQNEKEKIKLSELSELYDIVDDTETKQEISKDVLDDEPTFESTIKYGDKKLEDEFDEEV